jgi:hypothetical protein
MRARTGPKSCVTFEENRFPLRDIRPDIRSQLQLVTHRPETPDEQRERCVNNDAEIEDVRLTLKER